MDKHNIKLKTNYRQELKEKNILIIIIMSHILVTVDAVWIGE
jgi:hypothetical protein